MTQYTIVNTDDYQEWFDSEPPKSRYQIRKRLLKIEEEGYFGRIRDLGEDLQELKFNDGRRIYYVIVPINNVILLLGGNKNGQDSDITDARRLKRKYTETTTA